LFILCKHELNIESICKCGDIELLKWYECSHSYNIDQALIIAATAGNLKMVEYFVKLGVGASLYNTRMGILPKLNEHPEQNDNVDVLANYTRDNYIKFTGINNNNDIDCVNNFLSYHNIWHEKDVVVHCLVNASTGNLDIALYGAASNGRLRVVRFLVMRGANNNYALHHSKKYQHYDVVKYLEEYSVNCIANS
jgi:ankyrin repeat protein